MTDFCEIFKGLPKIKVHNLFIFVPAKHTKSSGKLQKATKCRSCAKYSSVMGLIQASF